MALTVDTTAGGTYSAGVTSKNWSHTISASANRGILADYSLFNGDIESATGATVGGVAMTNEKDSVTQDRTGIFSSSGFDPGSGAKTVQINFSGTVDVSAGSTSFIGADQTDLCDNAATTSGSSTTPSVTVTSAVGNIVLDILGGDRNRDATKDASQSAQWNTFAAGVGGQGGASTTKDGAASVTMNWTLSASANWSMCAISVRAAAGGASQQQLTMTGVGP